MVGQLLRLVAFRVWLPRAYANAMTSALPVAAGGTPAPVFHRNEDIRDRMPETGNAVRESRASIDATMSSSLASATLQSRRPHPKFRTWDLSGMSANAVGAKISC